LFEQYASADTIALLFRVAFATAEFNDGPAHAFPGYGQMKQEQA
jgi:hypothetical protein